MNTKNPKFVVVYRLPLTIALIAWLFGWGILWNLLSSGGVFPRNSPGPWFDVLFWASAVSVNGLLGPVLALKYSLSIDVQENRLSVRRYFGLISRSYELSDIAAVDVFAPDAKMPKVRIAFVNGDSLTVSGYASRFQELRSVLAAS